MKYVSLLFCLLAVAGARAEDTSPTGQATWMLQRLTGVKWPSDSPVIAQMAQLIQNGDAAGAAAVATKQPQFLNVTVKEMAAQLSTREETVGIPLNDFTATIMGVTRDETDARELLFGNFIYQGDPTKISALTPAIPMTPVASFLESNEHYRVLERANVDIGATLVRVNGQMIATSDTTAIANPDPGGILTSHSFLGAHAIGGTNRRLVEYTFREFMCTPIVGWADTSAPDIRIGRDIDRVPGGDATKFQTTCKGCHSQMDSFRGAFAKWDFINNVGSGSVQGAAIHAANGVASGNFQPNLDNGENKSVMFKYNRPNFVQYSGGFITSDDSFINNATRGANATRFGWRGMAPDASAMAGASTGVHALGRLVSNSQQFSRCFAQHVFSSVCKHDLSENDADALYASLAITFEQNGYNLKKLYQSVATNPKCRL